MKRNFVSCIILLSLCSANVTTAFADTLSPKGLFSDDKENGFILSASEWLSIQRYTGDLFKLPNNELSARLILQIDPDQNFARFEPLVEQFSALHELSEKWNSMTYIRKV